MARTVMPKANRFHIRGNLEVLWVPRTATGRVAPGVDIPAGPLTLTTALLDEVSTVDLTNDAISVTGFTRNISTVPVPDISSLTTNTIRGEATLADSSIDFYLSSTIPVEDVRSVLHEDDEGYVLLGTNGFGEGAPVTIAEVTVQFPAPQYADAARITVPFAVEGLQENVAVPAA